MNRSMRHSFVARWKRLPCVLTLMLACLLGATPLTTGAWATPQVILVRQHLMEIILVIACALGIFLTTTWVQGQRTTDA